MAESKRPGNEGPPTLAAEAQEWLTQGTHDCVGTEVVLRDPHTPYRLAVRREGGKQKGPITCVSVLTVRGWWFLEARPPKEGVSLVESIQASPQKLTTSGLGKKAIRPTLRKRWTITREHDLLAMVCRKAPRGGAGRWAREEDLGDLASYQKAYNIERRTEIEANFLDAVRGKRIAVLDHGGRPAAFAKLSGQTGNYACIGGMYTLPEYRKKGLGKRLTAFLIGELLKEKPAVHLIVDDDNEAAIALYRSLGFEEVGTCYMAYLKD